jgi:hypothetical protein
LASPSPAVSRRNFDVFIAFFIPSIVPCGYLISPSMVAAIAVSSSLPACFVGFW